MHLLAEQFCRCSTSSVADALDEVAPGCGGVIHGLRVLGRPARAAGPIETVRAEVEFVPRYPVEDFSIGRQIERTQPNAVLVIDGLDRPVSNWGGLAARAAMGRRVAAAVIRGGARDAEELESLDFLLAASHVTPLTGKGRIRYAERGGVVAWGGVVVHPGDWAVIDRTGLVVVPADAATQVAPRALEMESADAQFVALLDRGIGFEEARRQVRHF